MNKPVYLSEILMCEFQYIYAKPKHGEKANVFIYGQCIQYTQKQMIFIKTLQKMLKLDLTLQIMKQTIA